MAPTTEQRGIEALTLDQLSARERAEVERALGTDRFSSTMGTTLAWVLPVVGLGAALTILGLLTLGGLKNHLYPFDRGAVSGLRHLAFNYPFPAGLLVGPSVGLLAARFAWRRRGRQGWVALPWGVAQLAGTRLRLLRYADVARLEFREFRSHQKRFTLAVFVTRSGVEWLSEANTLFHWFKQEAGAPSSPP